MRIDKDKIMKICVAALLFAVLVRVFVGFAVPALSVFQQPKADQLLCFGMSQNALRLPSGHHSTVAGEVPTVPSTSGQDPSTQPTTQPTTQPNVPQPGPGQPPVFTAADQNLITINNQSNRYLNVEGMLTAKVELQLQQDGPTVLIVHSHATECYIDGPKDYVHLRCKDTNYNMISVGDALTKELEAAGIRVIHDRTLHDLWNYSGGYDSARKSVQEYLEQYPSIQLVLDLHRDALYNADGSQQPVLTEIGGEQVAQVMLVMGTDETQYHPNWRQNMSLALQLQAQMERQNPGFTRNTIVRDVHYNQDLSVGSLLIEFGTAGNTHQQVIRSVPYVAQAIVALMNGTN